MACRSFALSSTFFSFFFFFVLHCTDFNPLDKSHEWHQDVHWEREEKKKKQWRRRKRGKEDAKRIRISQSSN